MKWLISRVFWPSLASFIFFGFSPNVSRCFGDAAQPDAAQKVARIHEELSGFGDAVGGLSKEQQAKLDEVEAKIAEKVKADPASWQDPSFIADVMKQYREILTPNQQAKFDKLMEQNVERMKGILTANHLRSVVQGIEIFNGEQAAKIVAELKAGINPPKSLAQ